MLTAIPNGDVASFLADYRKQQEYELGFMVAVTCEGHAMLAHYEKAEPGEFILPQGKWPQHYSIQDAVWMTMKNEYGVTPPERGSVAWHDLVCSLNLCYLNTSPRGLMWWGKKTKAMLAAHLRLPSMTDINLVPKQKSFSRDNCPQEVRWVRAANHFDLDVIQHKELKGMPKKDKRLAQIAIIAAAVGIDYEFERAA